MNLPKDVNVLLIGATGQEKRFFINMFDKMAVCATPTEAEGNPGGLIMPIQFDNDGECIVESIDQGSAYSHASTHTQEPTIYEYPTRCGTMRLMDIPGIGDTQEPRADQTNVEKIISSICHFDEIHAILLFFSSTDNRLDSRVKYQVCELLSCLSKAAVNIIKFIITDAGVRAELGQARTVIEGFIRELSVDIPFDRSNTFFFASEPLKYLVLRQQGRLVYDRHTVGIFRITYLQSVDEYVRLFAQTFKCPQPYSMREYRALIVARQMWPRLRMSLLKTRGAQQAIEEGIMQHGSNLGQILRNIAKCETDLETSKGSFVTGVMDTTFVATNTLGVGVCLAFAAGAFALPFALPAAVAGACVGYMNSKLWVKKKVEDRRAKQNYYERKYETERSRKEKEEEALEAQRAIYARFTNERARVVQLEKDFARCLHQNSVMALSSVKVQILRDVLRENGHTLSTLRRGELEGQIQEVEEQERLFAQVSVGDGQQRALNPEELFDRINEVRDLEYYGPPIRQALDDCNIGNAADFSPIVRAQAARGCMFDMIYRECRRT